MLAKFDSMREQNENLIAENSCVRNKMAQMEALRNSHENENIILKRSLKTREKEIQKLTRAVSHLKEELCEMQDEGDSLYSENQQYLDMIIRFSLGKNRAANGAM